MDIQALVSGNIPPPAPALEFAAVAALSSLLRHSVRHLFQGTSCFFLFQLFAISSQQCTKDDVCWLTWSQWITRKKKEKDELGDCFRIKSPVFSKNKKVPWWCLSMASKNPHATLNCHSILKIILKDSGYANLVPHNKKLQSKTPYCHLPQNSKNNMIIIGFLDWLS